VTNTSSHFRLFAIVCGLLVFAAASYRLWQMWTEPVPDSWTPKVYATGLETTVDKFEVLIAGVPLAKVAGQGNLMMTSNGYQVPVKESDIKARVNNGPAMKAASVPIMLGLAALAGGALVLFVIGLATPSIGAFHPHGPIELHLTS
jgi:hypothetical protein